jgi:putative PIG3 family NAD(P)H quinone oxidoreductase
MKALLQEKFGNAETLYLGETQSPELPENHILIQIKAFGLNRADIVQREGNYPPPQGVTAILGLECSGVIQESKSTKWKKGDFVFGLLPGGAYAEYAVMHEDMAIRKPEEWTFEEATAIPEAFLTAFQALFLLGNVQKLDKVLIHAGASGVGNAAIQLAKSFNCEVFTTCSSTKLDFCKSYGADVVIDYAHESFDAIIQEKTSGKGVNLVIDFIGGNYVMKNISCLGKDGKIIQLATLGGTASVIDLRKLMAKRGQLIASTLRSRSREYQVELTRQFWNFSEHLFQKGVLKPAIDSIWSWNDIQQAHLYMEVNRNKGKIVVQTY